MSAHAQSSLASRVLIVYDPSDPSSSEVATYYQGRRGVPTANLCAVSLNGAAEDLTPAQYASIFKTPVQGCLNTVGPSNILYIVLAWLRPYRINQQSTFYALDSFLADIWDQYSTQYFAVPNATHRYYYETQSQGDVYAPFQSLAAYRALGRYATIYSVWRLDGATKDIAKALVDKSIAAEINGGPISLSPPAKPDACIDMRLDPVSPPAPDSGYYAGNWDLWRASQFLIGSGAFNVVTDTNDAPFGTPPAPATCGNANTGLYTGWYNFKTYNDAFTWDTGSIGWDLDSAGMIDPRSGTSWSTVALQKGIAITSGSMDEPYLEGIPRPGGVIHDFMEGANAGDAFLRNTRWIKWRMINVGDPLYQPYPNKLPPFNATDAANSLSLSARQVVQSSVVLGTVTISTPAPANGTTVNLITDNYPGVSVPSSVIIPTGASSANFPVNTSTVTSASIVQITASATAPSFTVKNTITVYPLLSGLGFAQNPVKGGTLLTAAVFLNASAPLGGITVTLSSDQPGVASVPASAVVPQGLSQVLFQIQTSRVGSNTTVNISSSYAGATQAATLTVTP